MKNYETSVGVCKVTYYCGCKKCGGTRFDSKGNTIGSTGKPLKANHSIAVDPSVIPLGSEVLIGDTVYTAEDTGGAIRVKSIDIYLGNTPAAHKQMLRMGSRQYWVCILH